jgi:hypothetical protein
MQSEISNTIINDVLQLIVPLIISGIIGYAAKVLVPAAKAFIEAHADERLRALIDKVVDTAVRGAEAARLRAALEGSAFDALERAVDAAEDMLLRYGITLDKAEMIAAIMAALHKVRSESFQLETVTNTAAGGPVQEASANSGVLPFDDEHTTRSVAAAPTYQQAQYDHVKRLMWL